MWFLFKSAVFLLFFIDFSRAQVIDQIKIEGARFIPEDVIMGLINLRQGSLYSSDLVRESIVRMYRTGFFEQVEVYEERVGDKVNLVYRVKDLPVIYRIEFVGNRKIRSSELERKIGIETEIGKIDPEELIKEYTSSPAIEEKLEIQKKLRLGRVLTQEELELIKRRIVETYIKEGYTNVEVTYELVPKKGASKVVYTIKEGKREYVRWVKFTGNKSFRRGKLLSLMKIEPKSGINPWSKPPFSEEILKEDVRRLKEFYNSEGFLDAKVEYTLEKEGRRYDVTIKIEEGPRYKLAELKLEGNTYFTQKELLGKILRKNKGDFYRKEVIDSIKENIRRRYSEIGFLNVSIQEEEKVDRESRSVSLTLRIEEGEPVYVRRIDVKGNYESRDYVIRRELRFQEGELANLVEIERSRTRVLNLGYYKDISVEPVPSEDREWDFIAKVREGFTGQFSVGLAYNQVTGVSGLISLRKGNFLGTGDIAGISLSYGSKYRDNSLSYTKKWFLNRPFELTGSIFEKSIDYPSYTVERRGLNLILSREFAEFWKISSGVSFQNVKYSDVSPAILSLLDQSGLTRQSRKFLFSISRDTRDNYLFPSKGALSELDYTVAVAVLGGNERFNRITLSHQHFFKDELFDTGFIFSFRGLIGIVEPYGGQKLPVDEKFFVGGDFDLRGYKYGYAGPIDPKTLDPIGSKKEILLSAELNYPLYKNIFYLALFYDTGLGFDKWKELRRENLRGSYGVGVRFVLPVAPIRIDLAFKTKKVPGDTSRSRTHYVLGAFF